MYALAGVLWEYIEMYAKPQIIFALSLSLPKYGQKDIV